MTTPNAPKDPSQVVADDPFGGVKLPVTSEAPEPLVVKKFHTRADTDSSVVAAHHTLGISHNQSSGGDHIHDGISSKQLMSGTVLIGAKGGNVALANLITALAAKFGFTDSTT